MAKAFCKHGAVEPRCPICWPPDLVDRRANPDSEKLDRTNLIITKPEQLQRAPKIECKSCHRQAETWCEHCGAPLCITHAYLQYESFYCQEHAAGYVLPRR